MGTPWKRVIWPACAYCYTKLFWDDRSPLPREMWTKRIHECPGLVAAEYEREQARVSG